MCRAVSCKSCGKTTWAGCGQHVEQVMRGVPAPDRCPGHPRQHNGGGGSFLGRLIGRG